MTTEPDGKLKRWLEIREEASVRKEALQSLLSSQGWDILREILESQIKLLIDEVTLQPLSDSNGVYAQEFSKGHLTGLRTFLALPGKIVGEADEMIEAAQNYTMDEEEAPDA